MSFAYIARKVEAAVDAVDPNDNIRWHETRRRASKIITRAAFSRR